MRLFIAINFDEDTKRDIRKIIDSVKENSIRGRFVKDEHLHLTLEFLGDIPLNRVETIKKVMDQVSVHPFTIRLNGIGFFRRRGGSIYWLGVEKNHFLLDLKNQLHERLKFKGFILNNGEYKPHITIGRKVVMEETFKPEEMLDNIRRIEYHVNKLELMRSQQIDGKLVYSAQYTKRL